MDTDYLTGVPASEEWTLSHNITTKYLANALCGVQAGLAAATNNHIIDGIAGYPFWEIDENEWKLLDQFS